MLMLINKYINSAYLENNAFINVQCNKYGALEDGQYVTLGNGAQSKPDLAFF